MSCPSRVPAVRRHAASDAPVDGNGDLVVYWMIAQRRLDANFALERAVEWSRHLGRPLLILEPLRCDYPWASDRMHRFVLDGMVDKARRLRGARARYHPWVETRPGEGRGLLEALARRACLVVTDEYPTFFLPPMVAAAARRLPCRLEVVDSCGLVPLRAADRAFPRAHSFRRFLQRCLPGHLAAAPRPSPLRGDPLPALPELPGEVERRWPATPLDRLADPAFLAGLPIDHGVPPVVDRGGPEVASRRLREFIDDGLDDYGERRNRPEDDASSGLSPYLHFGHVSAHEVVAAVLESRGAGADYLEPGGDGARRGWWGLDEGAEAFLDQLVTWRELGFNTCWMRDDHDEYESLPDWAQATLAEHADDPRPWLYDLDELDAAATHDELWNAAQRQLRREGRIHNYLRMLWGKKVLEWARSPVEALEIMIELNNRYAVDGRDPNSYSGIFWVLGRHDRPWGPERPVFGKVRYMSSESTARKYRVDRYLHRHGPGAGD